MKYELMRNQIKSGDVLLWTHRSWKTWYDIKVMLVRLFQMSAYSHVGIAVVLAGRVWVLEAVTPKVRMVPLSNLLPCYHMTNPIGTTEEDLELGILLVGKEEIEYSQAEAIRGYFGRNDPENNQIECGELVCMILRLPCHAVPSDISEYMLDNGSTLTAIQP
jgi:hypothetical protein